MRPPKDQIARARETRAWVMRSRGLSHARIAEELRLTPSGVSRLLSRVERRELKRMSGRIERVKVAQHMILEHIASEALEAWERSKLPRKRAGSKRSIDPTADRSKPDGGRPAGPEALEEILSTEVIERDGDPSYLYCAMQGLANIRSLWGLDVAPAQQDAVTSITSITRDIAERGKAYEDSVAQEAAAGDSGGPGGADPGGAPEVQDGPGPVQ